MSSLSCARRAAVPTRGRPAPAHPSGSTNGRSFHPGQPFRHLGDLAPPPARVLGQHEPDGLPHGAGFGKRPALPKPQPLAPCVLPPLLHGIRRPAGQDPLPLRVPFQERPARKGARRGERPLRPLGRRMPSPEPCRMPSRVRGLMRERMRSRARRPVCGQGRHRLRQPDPHLHPPAVPSGQGPPDQQRMRRRGSRPGWPDRPVPARLPALQARTAALIASSWPGKVRLPRKTGMSRTFPGIFPCHFPPCNFTSSGKKDRIPYHNDWHPFYQRSPFTDEEER